MPSTTADIHRRKACRHIAFVAVNFDDQLNEHTAECRVYVEADLATNPPAGEEVALDIKPPVFWAERAS